MNDSPAQRESWPNRMQLVIRRREQPITVVVLGACIIGMTFYFWHRSIVNNGLIDIDRSQRLRAEFTVDINSDPWPAIANLPGIGEKLARVIVQHRNQHGPFNNHAELVEVAGIGPAKLKRIRPLLAPIKDH